MGINQLWRTALMSASLELRKSMLKGRIWGFGIDDDDNSFAVDHPTSEHGRRVPSTVLEHEETNVRESPVSYDQLPLSRSCDLGTLRSSGYLTQSSSTLGFDSDTPNSPLHRSTRPRAESASSTVSSSAGQVREIVRNLERAASSSEDVIQGNEDVGFASSEMTSESDEDSELAALGNSTIIDHGPEDRSTNENVAAPCLSPDLDGVAAITSPSTSQSSSASRASTSELLKTPPLPSFMNFRTVAQSSDPSSLLRQDFNKTKGAHYEEPSIEALLREEEPCEGRPRAASWGAKAWEGEFPGGTSRRVPASVGVPKTDAEPLANIERSWEEMISVPRTVWDSLCRRLDETERRIALLEKQEAEQGKEAKIPEADFSDGCDTPKSLPGGLSAANLPPYLVIVSVGVCALVAQYVFGRVVGRRPPL
jgi:hypothetical protein